MITIPSGAWIVLATRPVDFRRDAHSLTALAAATYGQNPFKGALIVFRAKRADRVKLLLWDGSGPLLIWKQTQDGAFRWPAIVDGVIKLTTVEYAERSDGGIILTQRNPRPTKAGYNRDAVQADGIPIDALPEDPAILRALLLSARSERDRIVVERNELAEQNERLQHLVLKLVPLKFVAKSERLPEEQLQLALGDVETAIAQLRRKERSATRSDGVKGSPSAG